MKQVLIFLLLILAIFSCKTNDKDIQNHPIDDTSFKQERFEYEKSEYRPDYRLYPISQALSDSISSDSVLGLVIISNQELEELVRNKEKFLSLRFLSISLDPSDISPSVNNTLLNNLLCNFIELEYLTIGGARLTSIPSCCFQLNSLKVLELSFNQINTIPDSIANLSSLKRLILFDNQIKQLSHSIIEMDSLKALIFGGERMTYEYVDTALLKRLSMKIPNCEFVYTTPDSFLLIKEGLVIKRDLRN